MTAESVANLGAYASNYGPSVPTQGGTRALAGPYRTPVLHVRVRAAYTNTAPTDAYRGAGRPENVYLLERLIDKAAQELGMDPAELRRRNLVAADAMPHRTPLGQNYDSGDFATILETACEASGWRAARRSPGAGEGVPDRLRGIGLAFYVDPCGANRNQWAALRFDAEGAATVLVGSQSTGQGHETAYAQIVADHLGIPAGQVRVLQGDTDLIAHGSGSSGSRSLPTGGNAVLRAAKEAAERGRAVAARLLEARVDDIRFSDGRYRIAGTDRSLSFAEVARASFDPALRPEAESLGLDGEVNHMARAVTFANGCHVCEVEVERATGVVRIVRYVAVDDFGRILNPLLVAGQVHGGVAQGVGQALCEHAVYDKASGQLIAGSFMDYTLPRADESAVLRRPPRRDTVPDQPAGREGLRRGRLDRGAGGRDERGGPCAPRLRRARCDRDAGHTRGNLARPARAVAAPAKGRSRQVMTSWRNRKTLILSRTDMMGLLEPGEYVDCVETAYRRHGEGRCYLEPKGHIVLDKYPGEWEVMPSYIEEPAGAGVAEAAACKWVSIREHNRAKFDLPTVFSILVYTEPETGFPLAIVDGSYHTMMRTGASAAVSIRWLARKDASVLALVGAGDVGIGSLRTCAAVRDWSEVRVWSRTQATLDAFMESEAPRHPGLMLKPSTDLEAVVRGADAVVTTTTGADPVVRDEWIVDGAHIAALGSDLAGNQELESAIAARARIFVDDIRQCVPDGEINVPIKEGAITADDVAGEIGAVICGSLEGRRDDAEVTLFDSTGIAIQDSATVPLEYQRAVEAGVGIEKKMIST